MRAQRLLSILMHLQVNRRMTARDLARKLEVSERTILRDMDALSSSGVPVVAGRGAGGGWSLLAEYETRLTGLSPEEIQSLIVSRAPKLAAAARRQADLMRQRVLIDPRGWRNPAETLRVSQYCWTPCGGTGRFASSMRHCFLKPASERSTR
jgi:biotin operon repressor